MSQRRMFVAFLRTLAVTAAVTLLVVLMLFAAVQGALDGNPLTPGYWAKWWPFWLPFAVLVPAVIAAFTGRAGPSLAWSGAFLLLIGAMALARLAALG